MGILESLNHNKKYTSSPNKRDTIQPNKLRVFSAQKGFPKNANVEGLLGRCGAWEA
jgi:hypothetical protein